MSQCECGAIGDYRLQTRVTVAISYTPEDLFSYMIMCFNCACDWFAEFYEFADQVQLVSIRKFWNYCGNHDVH
jgi:hypothetical protein